MKCTPPGQDVLEVCILVTAYPLQSVFFGSLSNIGVSSNSSTTHGRERFLLTSVFILISPSKAVKSENGIVQSCENQMLLSLTP